jgi:hypothetical protein
VWSRAKDRSGHAFKRVWRLANNGTCLAVETLVELRKVVHEETTTTTVGTKAIVVAPLTKDEIKDHLCQKYIAAEAIRKKEYDNDPPYHCWSNEEEENLMKKLKLFEYPNGGMFATDHPIDLVTHHNVSYIDAFPNMQLRSPQGKWVCPLSNQVREWRRKNDVSFGIKAHCGGNCSTVPITTLGRVPKTTNGRGGKRYYAPIHA